MVSCDSSEKYSSNKILCVSLYIWWENCSCSNYIMKGTASLTKVAEITKASNIYSTWTFHKAEWLFPIQKFPSSALIKMSFQQNHWLEREDSLSCAKTWFPLSTKKLHKYFSTAGGGSIWKLESMAVSADLGIATNDSHQFRFIEHLLDTRLLSMLVI